LLRPPVGLIGVAPLALFALVLVVTGGLRPEPAPKGEARAS
jgi:hypothetical protein